MGDVVALVVLMIAMILFRIWLDRKISGETNEGDSTTR